MELNQGSGKELESTENTTEGSTFNLDLSDDNSVDRYLQTKGTTASNTGDTKPVSQEKQASTPVQTHKIKHNGVEHELSYDDLIANAQKGFDYDFKSKLFAPMKELSGLLKSSGITNDDINLLVKAKAGDSVAYSLLAKRMGVNLFDLDEVSEDVASKYTASQPEGKSEVNPRVSEMISMLEQTSPDSYKKIMDTQQVLPEKIWGAMLSDPRYFMALNQDVESGAFEAVISRMQKEVMSMTTLNQHMINNDMAYFVKAYNDTFEKMKAEFEQSEAMKKSPQTLAKVGIQSDGMTRQPAKTLTGADLIRMKDEDVDRMLLSRAKK